MLTNPYILYNDMAGTWQDLNKPANSANGGTNWADSAEYGTDYKVSVKITQDEVSVTIDDVPISLSTSSSSDTLTGADILDYISKCDKFTFGVGLAQASFWNTELCTIKNFSAKAIGKDTQSFIGEVEEVEKITAINDNSWKINTHDAILYLDNPVKGVELEKLKISYDVTFADNAAKNGWDGLFSFYDPGTNGRVSIQSAPFLCFNDWAGVWANINKPGLDGSTDWAASAVAGTKHHVDITVTADEIVMSVDDTPIDFAEEASDAYTGYQNILDLISKCENLTIGVGLATSSSWNTEICTLENLTIVANDGEDEDEDSDGRENPDSGSKPGNNGSQPNNGSKPGTGSTDKGDTDNDTTDTPAAGTATGKTHIEERESDGKQIIVDKNGEVIVNKLVTIDSKTYITNAQGEIIKNRFATTAKGNTVYATKTGAIKKSITFTVNGKRYYAKPSGAIAKSGFIKTALGNTVYATKSGVLKSGKVFTVDGKKYYAKASGAIAKNRWVTVGNKKYYCNKKGVITKTKTVS
jgi:glucan-binding YG repeat protein